MENNFDRISEESATLEELRREFRSMGQVDRSEEVALSDLAEKISGLKANASNDDREAIWSRIEAELQQRGVSSHSGDETEDATG